VIRYRALLIAASYPEGNDCDAFKSDPAFKMAVAAGPRAGPIYARSDHQPCQRRTAKVALARKLSRAARHVA
jgi:hypothetical protein